MLRRHSTPVLATPTPPAACDVRAYSNSGWLWSCFRCAVHIGASFGGFIQLRNEPGILIFPSPRRRLSDEAFEPDYREGPTARFPGHAERLQLAHRPPTILWCCICVVHGRTGSRSSVYARRAADVATGAGPNPYRAPEKRRERAHSKTYNDDTAQSVCAPLRSSPTAAVPHCELNFHRCRSFRLFFFFCQVHTLRTQL